MTNTPPKTHSQPAAPAALSVTPCGDGSFVVSPAKPVAMLSVNHAARRAGVSVETIYRLVGEGRIKAQRPSRMRILVDAESLAQHQFGHAGSGVLGNERQKT